MGRAGALVVTCGAGVQQGTVSICRCFKSKTFPLCDGSHNAHNTETGTTVDEILLHRRRGKASCTVHANGLVHSDDDSQRARARISACEQEHVHVARMHARTGAHHACMSHTLDLLDTHRMAFPVLTRVHHRRQFGPSGAEVAARS